MLHPLACGRCCTPPARGGCCTPPARGRCCTPLACGRCCTPPARGGCCTFGGCQIPSNASGSGEFHGARPRSVEKDLGSYLIRGSRSHLGFAVSATVVNQNNLF